MKTTIKWHKELINAKWFSVANVKHVPMIEHCKDGSYKLRNANGKAIIHKNFGDAVKLAIDVYKKYRKCSKAFDKSNV